MMQQQEQDFFIVHKKKNIVAPPDHKLQQQKQQNNQESQIYPFSSDKLQSIQNRISQRQTYISQLKSVRFSSESVINKQQSSASLVQSVTCPVCLLILQTPYFECQQCSNNFCIKCLQDWWAKNPNQCVFKCNQPEFKRVKRSNTYFALIQALKVKCQFCQNPFPLSQIQKHIEKQCQQIKQMCQYCEEKIERKIIQQHQSICQQKPEECEFCHEKFVLKNIKLHENKCPQKIVICAFQSCPDKNIMLKNHKQHVTNCLYAPAQCKWCSDNTLIKKQIEEHENICEKKKIQCQWCAIQFFLREIQEHLTKCSMARETCRLCRKQILTSDYDKHKIGCMFDNVVDIREINNQLVIDNIRLREKVALLEQILEQTVSNSKSSALSTIKEMKNQDRKLLQKDLQRIDYSIKSVEKLKKQQFEAHMKMPHWIQSWCPICKVLDKKFKDMLEPLLNSRKEVLNKIKGLQHYNLTPQ